MCRRHPNTCLRVDTGLDAVRSPSDWLLAPVALGQLDDQQLFELSLRLKYVDDPRVVLPALLELHGATLLDVPVEAVATRHGVLVCTYLREGGEELGNASWWGAGLQMPTRYK